MLRNVSILIKSKLKENVFVAYLKVMIQNTQNSKINVRYTKWVSNIGNVLRPCPTKKQKKTKLFILENMFIQNLIICLR